MIHNWKLSNFNNKLSLINELKTFIIVNLMGSNLKVLAFTIDEGILDISHYLYIFKHCINQII